MDNGQYADYPGITCISQVKYTEEYMVIENYIKNSLILSDYYSPLPYDSYHMTISPIFNKIDCADFNLLLNIDKFLVDKYSDVDSFEVGKKEIYYGNTIGINVYVTDNKIVSRIDETHHNIKNFFNKKTPSALPHITFAYNYKNIPIAKYKDIDLELMRLNKLIPNNIALRPPRITWFKDMLKFHLYV